MAAAKRKRELEDLRSAAHELAELKANPQRRLSGDVNKHY